MANRAQRRAQEKARRRGIPEQYDSTRGRGRSGMIDEYALQEKSIRLQEGRDGEWKPTAYTGEEEQQEVVAASNGVSVRGVARIISWTLIVLSALAFLVVMWVSYKPLWLVATIAGVFALSVLSLFFVSGDSKYNPRLDQNGTAL